MSIYATDPSKEHPLMNIKRGLKTDEGALKFIEKLEGDVNVGMNALGRDAGDSPDHCIKVADIRKLLQLSKASVKLAANVREWNTYFMQLEWNADPTDNLSKIRHQVHGERINKGKVALNEYEKGLQ